MPDDIQNIGLSERQHQHLQEMTGLGVFTDMQQGYRLGVAIALKNKLDVSSRTLEARKNMYDTGGVDDNFIIRNSIRLLYPEHKGQEYRLMEKLADAGLELLYSQFDKDHDLLNLIEVLADDS